MGFAKLYTFFNRDIFKTISIYTIIGFFQKAFPFLLLPFLTRVLTPTDYGLIAMFASVKAFFAPFVGLGSINAVERYYFDRKEIDYSSFLSNILLIVFFTTILFGGTLIFFGDYVYNLTQIPPKYMWAVIIVSIGLTVNRINQILFRAQNKRIAFALINLIETSTYFLLMILFVFALKYNWRADVFSQLVVYSGLAVFGFLSLNYQFKLRIKIEWEQIYRSLSFGFPILIHSLGLFFVNMIDKIFITKFVGIEATGIYNIGFKMAAIMVFIVTAFNNAYVPWLYGKLKEEKTQSTLKAFKSTLYASLVILSLGFILILAMPLAYKILIGESFKTSLSISMIIVVGEVFNSFYLILVSYILFSKQTRYVMYITLISSFASVLLNYFLILKIGINGAAYTLIIVYFIKFTLTVFFVKKLYNTSFNKIISLHK